MVDNGSDNEVGDYHVVEHDVGDDHADGDQRQGINPLVMKLLGSA